MISFPSPDWVEELKTSYSNLVEVNEIIASLSDNSDPSKGYQLQQGLLLVKGRMVVVGPTLQGQNTTLYT